MYIIYHTEGQSCNHYFQLLYYLKKSIQEGKKLSVLFPDITIGEYPILSNNHYISVPLYFKWLNAIIGNRNQIRIINRIYRKLMSKKIRSFITFVTSKQMLFVDGTEHWNEDIDYSDLTPILRPIFIPTKGVQNKVDPYLRFSQNMHLVGVHIRGGDYRFWRGGQYFFEAETYYLFMKKMLNELNAASKDVMFYISSNEIIDLNVFKGLNCVMIENATAVEDLYALSKCNYIIGTASTFSGWVSYLYRIPRYYFLAKDDYKKMSLSDFEIPNNNLIQFR